MRKSRLLRPDQVVAKLSESGLDDLDLQWINKQVERGRLPYTKVGRFRRFREDVIDSMIDRWLREANGKVLAGG